MAEMTQLELKIVADIAAALNPRGRSPMLFFPFQVNVNPANEADVKDLSPGEQDAAKSFRNQAKEILEASKKLRAKHPLADPKIKERLGDLGGMVLPGSPADFGKLIAAETEKWGEVVKFAGIKAE